jgi:flagellar biosynthesis protein FlhG
MNIVSFPRVDGPRRGRIIAVASGKGGVGKTWFAITLAHALARQGRRVLLFDGDLGLANVDIQLGLTPDRDLSHVVAGDKTLAEAALQYHEGGFDLVAGRSGSAALSALDPTGLQHVMDALRRATQGYDAILLDLGAGLDGCVRALAALARYAARAGDRGAYQPDRRLRGAEAARGGSRERRCTIVVNLAASRSLGERTYGTLSRACELFLKRTPALAGVIRRDDRVRDAIRRQALLLVRHPAAHASADVEAIARTLLPSCRIPPRLAS